jgi:hypothetical protein
MNWVKEFSGTITAFVVFAGLAFGITVGHASIPLVIPVIQGDATHLMDVQEAKCEMQADEVYRTADKDDAALPIFVSRCMTVAGYVFNGLADATCNQNFDDAAKTGQLSQLGGYDTATDPSCYTKYRPPSLFGP